MEIFKIFQTKKKAQQVQVLTPKKLDQEVKKPQLRGGLENARNDTNNMIYRVILSGIHYIHIAEVFRINHDLTL